MHRMPQVAGLISQIKSRNSCEECVQGGEDEGDCLSFRSLFAKEPLPAGLFCGN